MVREMNNIEWLKVIIKQLESWCELGIIDDTARDIITFQLKKSIKELELGELYKELNSVKDKYAGAMQYHYVCIINNESEKVIEEAHYDVIKWCGKEVELENKIKEL